MLDDHADEETFAALATTMSQQRGLFLDEVTRYNAKAQANDAREQLLQPEFANGHKVHVRASQ